MRMVRGVTLCSVLVVMTLLMSTNYANAATRNGSLVGRQLIFSGREPHGGLLPPSNPASNLTPEPIRESESCGKARSPINSVPCTALVLAAIDNDRAKEGVSPLSFDPATFEAMSPSEQLFAIVNLERVDRDLQPVLYLTAQLGTYAQIGANDNVDPSAPSSISGNALIQGWGSILANTTSVLDADLLWMYEDGWGGDATINSDCSSPSAEGCWGHRDNILFANPNSGCYLAMGAAQAQGLDGTLSFAEVTVDACGTPPSDVLLTWVQVENALAGKGQFRVSTQVLTSPKDFNGRYSTWLEVENADSPILWKLKSGKLPRGYSLSSNGHLTGPVSDPHGTYHFSVVARESVSPQMSSTKAFVLTF
jgi:hypothetical protein